MGQGRVMGSAAGRAGSLSGVAVVVAAGGTGGHLFPAFALTEALNRRGAHVELITDMRGDRYGMGFPAQAVHCVPAATLASKSPVAAVKTGITLLRGTALARGILQGLKPAVVVGFGGYPSVPPLAAARSLGIPTMLHEQNAIMGRANRMLARFATRIALSFANTHFVEGALAAKAVLTGNPVRDTVLRAARRYYDMPSPDGELRLLVFGGSQGARFFSDIMPPAVNLLPDSMRRRIIVTQQARDEDIERVRQMYSSSGIIHELAAFFPDLPDRIATSHVVIGRAGATTVAELMVIGRPSILVPLPHALDSDQKRNAEQLAGSGGAIGIEQSNLSPTLLAQILRDLFDEPRRLYAMARAARTLALPDAAERLADCVADLAAAQPQPAHT